MTSGMDQARVINAVVRWFADHQKKLSQLGTLFLLVIIAWISGQIFWHFMDAPTSINSWRAPATVKTNISNSNGGTDSAAASLVNANLFGQYEAKEIAEVKPEVVDAPKTRLNLILVGVVSSSDPKKALAVVSNRGTQETVGIDETISNTRAVLKNVLTDRVIIENAGRNETLMLEGIEYKKVSTSSGSNSKTKLTGTTAAGNNPEINLDDLDSIKEALTKNPQQFLKYIRLSQVNRDGELLGYRVRPGKERALFDSVGLEDGDIAVELNGIDLTDKEAMATIWKSFSDMTEVQLTVDRDGQRHEVYVQF